jgi:hypothetical protein
MDKVYLVYTGEYSSNRVVGVFSEEARAQKFASEFWDGRVVDWVLDDADTKVPPGHKVYIIQMYMDTGDVWEVYEDTLDEHYRAYELPKIDTIKRETFSTCCFARDDDHAVKVASESLAKWKVEHPGWDTDLGGAVKQELFHRVDFVYQKLSEELSETNIYHAYDILDRIVSLEIRDENTRDISDYYHEKLDGFVEQYESRQKEGAE